LCPDGTISQFQKDGAIVPLASWARPGALNQVLPGNRLAIIDQSTLQIMVNDLAGNRISTPAVSIPEFNDALQKAAAVRKEGAGRLPPGSPPLGKSLFAMASAVDASSWYVLVYPYNQNGGPAVVRFDLNGNVIGRYACHLPSPGVSSIHKIAVQNGDLILVSTAGTVIRYKL